MSNKRYHITLSEAERTTLSEIVSKGTHSARRINRARTLLSSAAGQSNEQIARQLGITTTTVCHTKARFVTAGLEASLSERPRSGQPRKLSGHDEALLVATTCSQPDEGHSRWTVRLLADKLVELEVVEHISSTTVYNILQQQELKPWQKKVGALGASMALT